MNGRRMKGTLQLLQFLPVMTHTSSGSALTLPEASGFSVSDLES